MNKVKYSTKTFELSERLSLKGLHSFVALDETKSLAKASEKLGVSKSSVSQHITTLEKNIGTQLFDRRQKPIALTPAGQVLRSHAHRILSMYSAAETALADISAGSLPMINIAMIDDLDASITPVLATSLHAQFPNSLIRCYSGQSNDVTERLVKREADIAVSAELPNDINRYQIHELFREQFLLVTAKNKYNPENDWRDQLSALNFVQYSDAMPMGNLVNTHLKRVKFDVQKRLSFESTRSVIATVAKTGGWTIATPLTILDASRFQSDIDLYTLPFAKLYRSIFIVNRQNELGFLSEVILKTLHQFLSDEILPEFQAYGDQFSDAIEIDDI